MICGCRHVHCACGLMEHELGGVELNWEWEATGCHVQGVRLKVALVAQG